MNLEQFLKESKFPKYTYIALYNVEENRFFGCFVYDKQLTRYSEYEVLPFSGSKEILKSDFIKCIKLDYSYALGLDSMERLNKKSKLFTKLD